MAHLTLMGTVLLLLAPTSWLFFIEWAAEGSGRNVDGYQFPLGLKLAGAMVALLVSAIRAYGLLGLRRTFAEAHEGRPLSEAAVLGFRRFARMELAMVFAGVAQVAANSAILSLAAPGGRGAVSITFGSTQIGALFLALLLLFAAEIFAEGKRAHDEVSYFL